MSPWKPITTAPLDVVASTEQLRFGRWVRLRRPGQEAVGRWRMEVAGYDINTDTPIIREGRWDGIDDQPLTFDPSEWAPHSSGMPA